MVYSLYQSECSATHCLWLSVGDEMVHKFTNFVKAWPLNSCMFLILHEEMLANHKSFILYTEVWLLSSGEVLEWLAELKEDGVSDFKFPQQYNWRCWTGCDTCHWVFSNTLKALHFVQNTGKHLPSNTVSHPRSESSKSRQDCTWFLILNLINTLKRW